MLKVQAAPVWSVSDSRTTRRGVLVSPPNAVNRVSHSRMRSTQVNVDICSRTIAFLSEKCSVSGALME